MISKKEFARLFEMLSINYQRQLSKEAMDFFYDKLKDIEMLPETINYILEHDSFFPPLNRILTVNKFIIFRNEIKNRINNHVQNK